MATFSQLDVIFTMTKKINQLQIFNLLAGSWQLQRQIYPQGKMTGFGIFLSKKTDELYYREEGVYAAPNNQQFQTHREYLYVYAEEAISVYFVEAGKRSNLFYTLNFYQPLEKNILYQAIASHLCVQDIYQATYDFFDKDQFTLKFDISGPTKNYKIETIFSRINKKTEEIKINEKPNK